jgi:hypothetical protein
MGQVNYRKKPTITTKDNRFNSSPSNTNFNIKFKTNFKIKRKFVKAFKSTDIENEIIIITSNRPFSRVRSVPLNRE